MVFCCLRSTGMVRGSGLLYSEDRESCQQRFSERTGMSGIRVWNARDLQGRRFTALGEYGGDPLYSAIPGGNGAGFFG